MANQSYLRNAPITEAVVDFRVQPSPEVSALSFSSLPDRLKDGYPQKQKLESVQAKLGVKDGRPTPSDTTYSELGIVLKSEDGTSLAQFRTDGFTFNKLAPYTRWEEVLPETLNLWAIYLELAKPEQVTRLATRYINRLKLPLPIVDLSIYLTSPPSIPQGLPQQLHGFLTRLDIIESNLSARLIQALERSPDPNYLVVLLDIDAYQEAELDPQSERIPEVLGLLRDFKNRIFFESITEETARLFE